MTTKQGLASPQASTGLTTEEAARRLERYGYNEVTVRSEALWHRIFRRFWGPIPWMIEVAAVLSAVVEKWEDFIIIMVMLLVNGILDFMQEHRANNAVAALKAELATEAIVLRDGAFVAIEARLLVPGDVIKLRIGAIVPADVELLGEDYLLLDQSSLTGESLPVTKTAGDHAFANTIVKQGEMTALVSKTGAHTSFHTTVSLVAQAEAQQVSHFQKMVIFIGDFLIGITVALVILILVVGLFRGEDFLELARFSLVLAVAAIPVALPAVLSVTMAVGALNLARRKAIVSRLSAIEELAGVDVLCSDKTGTLTKNDMQVADPVLMPGHDVQGLFLHAALASRAENRDPIEQPIFDYLAEHFPEIDLSQYNQTHFTPFDPVSKRTQAEITHGERTFTVVKGAAQVVLDLGRLTSEQRAGVDGQVEHLAEAGYRTLAVAVGSGDAFDIVGLIPLFDPPREDSAGVIADMRNYGVAVKMITGDNLAIAREVGRLLGLTGRAVPASELAASGNEELLTLSRVLAQALYTRLKDEVTPDEAERFADDVSHQVGQAFETTGLGDGFIKSHESALIRMIEDVDVFAEVVPEDKFSIVDTLQKADHIVAMTGDGVNDAPALKKADAGIAVSGATDAARSAADIILTAPGLGVIREAVQQARITFERMKSYAIFRIAETVRVIVFMTLAIVVFNFFPITALMIIMLALLNDIPILTIAYDNTKIDQDPVRWNMPHVLTVSSVLGLAGVVSSFLLFYLLLRADFTDELIQSMFFAKLVIAGHGTIYNTRTDTWFWMKPYPSWQLFAATFSTRVIGTLIAVYGIFITPIGWKYALYLWAYALAWFVFNDGVKMITLRVLRRRGNYGQ